MVKLGLEHLLDERCQLLPPGSFQIQFFPDLHFTSLAASLIGIRDDLPQLGFKLIGLILELEIIKDQLPLLFDCQVVIHAQAGLGPFP